jgi:hypothetical protein
MINWLVCSLDVGGVADPAALVVGHVTKPERITKARILHLALKQPVVTGPMHVEFVQTEMLKILNKIGLRAPVRYIIDVSNNSAVSYLLAQALPRNSLVGVKITGSESHAAGLQPLMVGDVGGRASSIPVMNLSRRQLLLDVGQGFGTGQLVLPRDDPEQKTALEILKQQMSRASLKVTASGKSIAVINRGHDDLLMALAQAWASTRLPPPRDLYAVKVSSEQERRHPSTLGWT